MCVLRCSVGLALHKLAYMISALVTFALQAFTDHYYNTFDTNRGALAPLYQDLALLTFEVRTPHSLPIP